MNCTQNKKIEQVTESTLVVGIDVGSKSHYARAFDWRGYEYSKKAFKFSNTADGFTSLMTWMLNIKEEHGKTGIIPGMEPTGHYWFNLGRYLKDNEIDPVLVNPHHVKKSKELDDNNPTKTDRKDPKTIAQLVKEGRYSYPYIPEGIYADLRTVSNMRFQITADLTRTKNRIERWLSIYFPEFENVYGDFSGVSSMMILKRAALPCDIIALGTEAINQIWRDAKVRAVGMKRAKTLVAAAENSIGTSVGLMGARMEIITLLEDYEAKAARLDEIMTMIEELCRKMPVVEKMLEIKGVGIKTVSGFLAEVGDIRRFDNPKQLQKYAGLALVEDSSGNKKGQTKINKRGRKRLRYLLFEVSLTLVAKNPEFKELHHYYISREVNPLKRMQSLMALACKLIRVFYAMIAKGVEYDASKMLSDIKRPPEYATAA